MNGIKIEVLIVVSLILLSSSLTGVKTHTTERKETSNQHNPILFIHGWTLTEYCWWYMKLQFEADGWPNTMLYAHTFDDTNNCSAQAMINNAHKLKQWIGEIINETGAEKIDLVGHSGGGVSSRYYIKFLGGMDAVDDYVSLGTAHHGANLTTTWTPDVVPEECATSLNNLFQLMNEGDETPGGILDDTVGIRQDPVFSNITYNGTHIPGSVNYTSIYSRDDEVCPPISCSLEGAHNIELSGLSHGALYQDDSSYKKVKAAVDDSPQTTTTPTTTSTTQTTTETSPTTTTSTPTTTTTTTPTTTSTTTTISTTTSEQASFETLLIVLFVLAGLIIIRKKRELLYD
ncbi:MAG: hypothetical protein JSV04_01750 [Candidatus Heimdallarchaeota archaeon]|nr:MAG: hypothetical protein JSV04_01750 [Candidatus Heimdallarchaeota archaeon]